MVSHARRSIDTSIVSQSRALLIHCQCKSRLQIANLGINNAFQSHHRCLTTLFTSAILSRHWDSSAANQERVIGRYSEVPPGSRGVCTPKFVLTSRLLEYYQSMVDGIWKLDCFFHLQRKNCMEMCICICEYSSTVNGASVFVNIRYTPRRITNTIRYIYLTTSPNISWHPYSTDQIKLYTFFISQQTIY